MLDNMKYSSFTIKKKKLQKFVREKILSFSNVHWAQQLDSTLPITQCSAPVMQHLKSNSHY